MLTLLPGILLNILGATLRQFGINVPPNIAALVTQLIPVTQKLILDLHNGGTPSAEVVDVLQTLIPAIQAVKDDTTLDPRYAEWAGLLDEMVANVVVADKDAQAGVDPAKLHDE
jgi:hypothetical protein